MGSDGDDGDGDFDDDDCDDDDDGDDVDDVDDGDDAGGHGDDDGDDDDDADADHGNDDNEADADGGADDVAAEITETTFKRSLQNATSDDVEGELEAIRKIVRRNVSLSDGRDDPNDVIDELAIIRSISDRRDYMCSDDSDD